VTQDDADGVASVVIPLIELPQTALNDLLLAIIQQTGLSHGAQLTMNPFDVSVERGSDVTLVVGDHPFNQADNQSDNVIHMKQFWPRSSTHVLSSDDA
jgi:hypothetical protein